MKLFWSHPTVQFNGTGISEAWAKEMANVGFQFTDDVTEADCAVFISDSQINEAIIGKVPTIAYVWGYEPARFMVRSERGDAFREQVREKTKLMRECDYVLSSSPGTQEQLMILGVQSHILIAGVDTALLDTAPDCEKKRQVLFLSRIALHKDLNVLIDAIGYIEPRINLVVSGPGDITEYEKQARSLNVSASFHQFTDAEKVRALKESTVLVHPSRYEGLGLPPLEALYLGTPVIMRDTPHNLWITHGGAMYFHDAMDLANGIASVVNDPSAFEQITATGQNFVREVLTLKRASERLSEVIHESIREFCGKQIRLHPERAAAIYDRDHRRNWFFKAQYFDPTWSRHWRAQHILRELEKVDAKNIADIGTGPVYATIFTNAGLSVTAVDHSKECLAQVESVALQATVKHKIITHQADATKTQLPSDFFDGAVLGEILEHVLNPDAVLAEAYRIIKPGGVVVCTTPYGHHHYDPMHIGPAEGGWDDKSIEKLTASYTLITLKKIAEEGTEPSCFLFTVKKDG